MRNFQELLIWQKSHQLTLKIYSSTRSFPKEEIFGLTSQVRRSSSSISANIAEGCGHDSNAEFKRYLAIALGSTNELEGHLILAKDLEYLSNPTFIELSAATIELRKMIYSFKQNIR
jgi:four helix bundle protein